MERDTPVEPEIARAAEGGLLTAITDLLEAAVDLSAALDAPRRIPQITSLCRDVLALAEAHDVIRRRSAP